MKFFGLADKYLPTYLGSNADGPSDRLGNQEKKNYRKPIVQDRKMG